MTSVGCWYHSLKDGRLLVESFLIPMTLILILCQRASEDFQCVSWTLDSHEAVVRAAVERVVIVIPSAPISISLCFLSRNTNFTTNWS